MPKITIFKGSDPEQDILDELKSVGIVGVSGGRLEVRAKLGKVQSLIDDEELDGYRAKSTLNHPGTELGYGYDEDRYSMQEAQEFVTNSYDEKIA